MIIIKVFIKNQRLFKILNNFNQTFGVDKFMEVKKTSNSKHIDSFNEKDRP